MIHVRAASSLALACVALAFGDVARAEPRAVIELFTSQGCSSCPPADKLLTEYTRDRTVIALSLAVDYWDYLGWKDTLAVAGHTNRQRAYAKVRGDRQVYTPQAVVNGAVHALGSDKSAIERAIRQTRQQAGTLVVPVTVAVSGDTMTVSVAAATDGQGTAEVWLCPMSRTVPVTIGKGENRGHTVTYSNVVRRWIKLGDWHGKAETYQVPLKDVQTDTVDAAAVVVQTGAAGAPKSMLGAAQIALRR
ncbi:MAG: DUF1223 domain-containing protein [Alphaproteobacteria bacterium]|nr:DUF1223 domain-containing protein [Alphaproteobacteria bacterium]